MNEVARNFDDRNCSGQGATMKLAAMKDSITLWKLKMIKDSIMEVPNNGRNSTVEVATVEVASIEIATMEDSIIWKLETIQDSIMEVSMGGIRRWKSQR